MGTNSMFHGNDRDMTAGKVPLVHRMENRGMAPFYYEWPIELGLIRADQVVKTSKSMGQINRVVAGRPC